MKIISVARHYNEVFIIGFISYINQSNNCHKLAETTKFYQKCYCMNTWPPFINKNIMRFAYEIYHFYLFAEVSRFTVVNVFA